MNYIVAYKRNGAPKLEFFYYRDETNIVYGEELLVRDEDDVIRIVNQHYLPDNGDMVIMETLFSLQDIPDPEMLAKVTHLHTILNDK